MAMLNRIDRFHLAIDALDRVPGLAERCAGLRQRYQDELARARAYTREFGDDPAPIRDWALGGGVAAE
jgi:xylulose-5-phosphate/fructose-6-phosphate phosphoketolase